jgi:hypothetical protein
MLVFILDKLGPLLVGLPWDQPVTVVADAYYAAAKFAHAFLQAGHQLALKDLNTSGGENDFAIDNISMSAVPEPSSVTLLALALPLVFLLGRKAFPKPHHSKGSCYIL